MLGFILAREMKATRILFLAPLRYNSKMVTSSHKFRVQFVQIVGITQCFTQHLHKLDFGDFKHLN